MEWAKNNAKNGAEGGAAQGDWLLPLPEESLARDILPKVIKMLVDRRRSVKKFIKSEKDPNKK